MSISLIQLNAMSQAEFTQTLGEIFEHTPAIAAQVWNQRPFATIEELHHQMVAVVQRMNGASQIALIQAHPDLGSKAQMADASVSEQASIGLDCLSAQEYQRFHRLNSAYKQRFGFPFIIAVRNHTKNSILAAFEARLTHDLNTEQQTAIAEICTIAKFRLEAVMTNQS
jgi:2-oxo-4-hydroxy-4-carboxy-5-ureidoimidazoline decarboxylase